MTIPEGRREEGDPITPRRKSKNKEEEEVNNNDDDHCQVYDDCYADDYQNIL